MLAHDAFQLDSKTLTLPSMLSTSRQSWRVYLGPLEHVLVTMPLARQTKHWCRRDVSVKEGPNNADNVGSS
jgi:hypothetical protein